MKTLRIAVAERDDRRPDGALPRHHADSRRHRRRDARRHPPAHARPARRSRAGQRAAAGARTRSRRRPAPTTSSSTTARSRGRPTRTCPRPGRGSRARRPTNGARGTSHRITFSYNIIAEGLADSTPREIRALEGLADPRQHHRHPDLRQSLRAQFRAQPAVQGRRARRDRQQLHLQPRRARPALQPPAARMGQRSRFRTAA